MHHWKQTIEVKYFVWPMYSMMDSRDLSPGSSPWHSKLLKSWALIAWIQNMKIKISSGERNLFVMQKLNLGLNAIQNVDVFFMWKIHGPQIIKIWQI